MKKWREIDSLCIGVQGWNEEKHVKHIFRLIKIQYENHHILKCDGITHQWTVLGKAHW